MIEYDRKYDKIPEGKDYKNFYQKKEEKTSKLEKKTFLGADIGSTI